MEKKSYSYGTKMTGLLLHSFFTIVLTVSLFLLATLINRNILELTDIGTDDFFSSGYYLKCMEQKCNDLYEYLELIKKDTERTAEEDKRYLQYNSEFKREDTNFCYWYMEDDVWYTNQPDTREGQTFDVQTILMEAKTMGDYLMCDMREKEFSTNIEGLDNYFLGNHSAQGNGNYLTYWPMEGTVLVIGVDTQLPVKDDLYDAGQEYRQLHPWIKVSLVAGMISLMGWILTLVYLTLAAGHREDEEGIYLCTIDRIKTEFLAAGFILISSELMILMGRTSNKDWDVSGLLVASGTISFIVDVLFLIFYLSMVRRLKAETGRAVSHRLIRFCGQGCKVMGRCNCAARAGV